MSTTTTKLGLIKPDYATDELESTLNALASNFQKIDDVSTDYADSPPTSGTWNSKHVIHANLLSIGGYVGWINLRTGVAAPKWGGIQSHSNGDHAVPTNDNGHYYTCIQTGYSGITEPIFPVSNGGEVQDTRGGNTWLTNHLYSVNDIALPTINNGRFYVCIQPGESGDVEPSWSTIDGSTTYDNNAVWHSYKIARWKESGTAALFRPFGKIE
ncbi:hypothetical protein SAMN04487895_101768 [Paenibacillus sophorae]|uniref:Uncharacterized protein n=1 Tax=Paenibacillus sophorae TaxID=1333845 RepID=A0A1H8H6W2_9BACL|nr:hypothetical protein [Paenibacillus sophorae]QWU14458.1 hypothetical protein KP014_21355 [Paenibacillus sophorae]SEN51719.1 hypothetical protein SAMN04487895_101768 [Paenibacillus sophorae]